MGVRGVGGGAGFGGKKPSLMLTIDSEEDNEDSEEEKKEETKDSSTADTNKGKAPAQMPSDAVNRPGTRRGKTSIGI